MKRILTLFFLLATLGFTKSHAQFDAGTGYIAAGLSNLNFNYTDKGGIRAGMNIDGGYFVADCLLARASFGYNHYAKHNDAFTPAGAEAPDFTPFMQGLIHAAGFTGMEFVGIESTCGVSYSLRTDAEQLAAIEAKADEHAQRLIARISTL